LRSQIEKLGMIALVAVAACSDQVTRPDTVPAADAAHIREAAAAAPYVTQALARAMTDASVQEAVKDAMRASRVVEHKLVLQEFLQTPAGETVLAAAARAAGIGQTEMARIVGLLPEMDFYVPERADRLEWRVGAPVAVGYTLDDKASTVSAFRGTGQPFAYGSDRDAALFFLQPAEPKGRRVHPQPATVGAAIQDPNDGEISLKVTTFDAAGNTHVVDFADLPMVFKAPQPQRKALGLSGLFNYTVAEMAGGRGTYLSWVQPYFADGVGLCEPYTKNYYKADKNSSTVTEYSQTSWGGMPCDPYGNYIWDFYNGYPPYGYFLLNNVLVSYYNNDKVALELKEDDSFSDDNYGWFDFFYDTRDGTVVNGYARVTLRTVY
jgi:hypothetical protein